MRVRSRLVRWMTLRYVSHTYEVAETALAEGLGRAPETDPDTSLKSLAEREGQSPLESVQRVQQAVAEIAPVVSADRRSEAPGWLGAVGDEFLAALLVYGYPNRRVPRPEIVSQRNNLGGFKAAIQKSACLTYTNCNLLV